MKETNVVISKHTPTPWHYDGEFIRTGKKRFDPSNGVEIIAEISDRPNWEANAEFIVRAVNSHEELLAAAKETLRFLEIDHCQQELEKAIAKAEGKS